MKINKAEVITGTVNDVLYIQYTSSNGIPCETTFKFNDTDRHQETFGIRCTDKRKQWLMYNIKHKRNKHFRKCKCWRRDDGQLMYEEPLI